MYPFIFHFKSSPYQKFLLNNPQFKCSIKDIHHLITSTELWTPSPLSFNAARLRDSFSTALETKR